METRQGVDLGRHFLWLNHAMVVLAALAHAIIQISPFLAFQKPILTPTQVYFTFDTQSRKRPRFFYNVSVAEDNHWKGIETKALPPSLSPLQVGGGSLEQVGGPVDMPMLSRLGFGCQEPTSVSSSTRVGGTTPGQNLGRGPERKVIFLWTK